MTTDADIQIGKNVAQWRGGKTQQAVADAMRERGHRWSQATVWSIEKGRRPIQLAEAQDLAKVLRCTVEDLGAESADVQHRAALNDAIRGVIEAYARVAHDVGGLLTARAQFAERLQEARRLSPLSPKEASHADATERLLTPERAVDEGRSRWSGDPLIPGAAPPGVVPGARSNARQAGNVERQEAP